MRSVRHLKRRLLNRLSAGEGKRWLPCLRAGAAAAAAQVAYGDQYRDRGEVRKAEACYRLALRSNRRCKAALTRLAQIQLDRQRWNSAHALLQRARDEGLDADVSAMLGELAWVKGELESAAEHFQASIQLNASIPRGYQGLAAIRRIQSRGGESIALLRRALATAPDQRDIQLALASDLLELSLRRAGDAAADCLLESLEYSRAVVSRAPGEIDIDASILAGIALLRLQRPLEAVDFLASASEKLPDNAQVHYLLGAALQELGAHDCAIRSFKQATGLVPSHLEARIAEAISCQCLGQHQVALEQLDKVLELQPGHALAGFTAACSHLALGNYAKGWELHERRLQLPTRPPSLDSVAPLWTDQDLEGKSILVTWEQGLGDTIQFCRLVALLAARGARVIVRVQPALVALLQDLAGASLVITDSDPIPAVDFWVPLLSLPHRLAITPTSLPAAPPYLRASSILSRRIAEILPRDGRLNVGLCWRGNPGYKWEAARSPGLEAFAPLMAGTRWRCFPLIRGQRETFLFQGGYDLGHEVDADTPPFMETAALIENLDLVISSDTVIAHLAGAMAKPAWIVLPVGCDWRWLDGGASSAWYPHTTLVRQSTPGDWHSPLQSIQAMLQVQASGKLPGREGAATMPTRSLPSG